MPETRILHHVACNTPLVVSDSITKGENIVYRCPKCKRYGIGYLLHFRIDKWNKLASLCSECKEFRVKTYDPCLGWLVICVNPNCSMDK